MKVQWRGMSLFKFYPETRPMKFHAMNVEKLLLCRFVLSADGMRRSGCAKLVQKIMNVEKTCSCQL
jgi:hypothetical protein